MITPKNPRMRVFCFSDSIYHNSRWVKNFLFHIFMLTTSVRDPYFEGPPRRRALDERQAESLRRQVSVILG